MTVIAPDFFPMSFQLMFSPSFWSLASLMKPQVPKKHGIDASAPGAVSINRSYTFFFFVFKGDYFLKTLFSQIGAIVKFVQILVKIERENRHAPEMEMASEGQGGTVLRNTFCACSKLQWMTWIASEVK